MDVTFSKDKEPLQNSKPGFISKLVSVFKNTESRFYFFLLLCFMGVIFFISSLINNQFTTLFGGDYASQQLSFYTNGYDDWWHFFKTGEFVFFDTNTYLGASNVGSNTFYYLFDPFFLPILICPREFIAQGMVVLTIFKIAFAGLFFLIYMRYMGASEKAGRISAFAYAFSGWMAWYLWFNHMTEITIIFPLMLLGVEKVLREKKPWLLMFSTALMGITNYFFLIGMSIAAFIYAIFRYFQRIRQNKIKDNLIILGIGFVGFLVGILMSMFAALPAALTSLEAPRSLNSSYLDLLKNALDTKNTKLFFSYIFEWKNFYFGQPSSFRHAYPLINFFFPCASCRGTPLMQFGNESYDNVATNIYSYVPMMLIFFPALVKSLKEKKWSVLVGIALMVLALEIPFTYYMFFGFTEPYGRWELFFITTFITFCGLHIDDMDKDPLWTKITSYILVMVGIISAGVIANKIIASNVGFEPRNKDITITAFTVVMCIYTTVVFLVMTSMKKEESRQSWIITFITVEAAVMGYLTIQGHWCEPFVDCNNGLEYNNVLYKVNQKVKKDDKSYYRCWSYLANENARNDGMRNDYNGLSCFHSIYNFELNNFLNWTRIQDWDTFGGSGSWAGVYCWKNADLDKFLGVKYYYIQNNSPQWAWMNYSESYQYNVPLGYEDVTETYDNEKFEVFRDTRPINFGVVTDSIYSYETKENSKESDYSYFVHHDPKVVLRNDELLLKDAILTSKDAEKISQEYPNLSIRKTPYDNSPIGKVNLGPYINAQMYDLSTATDGKVYTINTFFQDYADAYLGGAHALTCEELINVDNGKFTSVAFADGTNKQYGRYVSVLTIDAEAQSLFYDENGYSIYVPYTYSPNYGADIYLISEDDEIITWDRHQDDKYSDGDTRHRGLYVHRDITTNLAPKLKKIIISHREIYADSLYNNSMVYAESYTNQNNRYQKLYENKLDNVVYKTNTFTFETNFNKNMFVATQIPFEKGWSLKATLSDGTKKSLDVYSCDGGFVGFVAEQGKASYKLQYYPAYMKEGTIVSVIATGVFVGTFVGYYFFNLEKKKRRD